MFVPHASRVWPAIVAMFWMSSPVLFAGGPRYVAGASFFDPAVMGQPVHWTGGQVSYFVDQGPLNDAIGNAQATAMVEAAAALWNAVPTAGVKLVRQGSLNEDVNGANLVSANQAILQPSDVAASATSYPLGIIYDADGSVLDGVLGDYTSDPTNCENNGVMVWVDNLRTDATIAHAVMVLNGRCATTPDLVTMMQFQLERAFGQILGLGASQVNPNAENGADPTGLEAKAWPVMQPRSGSCDFNGGTCIPNPGSLKPDDMAALNRLYPITAANLAAFPGKVLTAANTISIDGTIRFRAGTGMQGVNVVARPIDANGDPLTQYTVTAVSGAYFGGNHGNEVTGWNDTNGIPLSQWGSTDAALQGYFDLRYLPLPAGMTTVSYQITYESIDPLYYGTETVGPYTAGSPDPSGTLAPATVFNLSAGMAQTLTITAADSSTGEYADPISSESSPRTLPASGLWCGRLSQISQTDWFSFPVRGDRIFTIVTQALDENGQPSNHKAMPALGVWDGFAPVGSSPVHAAPGLNGWAVGESWLQVASSGDDIVRLGVADTRGDGRPDYAYNGWVLYADTVSPARLPVTGGPIVIHGMGFHVGDTVQVGGQPAPVTSVSPNEITAIAPAAGTGVTGSVDVEVDDQPVLYAIAVISGGVSYDAGSGDALTLVTAPQNTVPTGVPIPFTVRAFGPSLKAAGGVTVTYTVTSGNARLDCGKTACAVSATGDGIATLNATATDSSPSIVIASLGNGSSVQAHFSGGTSPVLSALTPMLSVAAGATVSWPTQTLVLNGGVPAAGQSVNWQGDDSDDIEPGSAGAVTTSSNGIATKTLTVGPLSKGAGVSATACLNGTSQCVSFNALGARPEYATLQAVSGTSQSMAVSATPAPITLRVLDMNGNAMAAGSVTLFQSVYAWAPPCPPHGRCAQPQLLGTQTATAVSGLDGTVTFTPASLPGVATTIVGVATTGNNGTQTLSIEQHP
jgi:hypothetical protein